jgi:hypothetical protein
MNPKKHSTFNLKNAWSGVSNLCGALETLVLGAF